MFAYFISKSFFNFSCIDADHVFTSYNVDLILKSAKDTRSFGSKESFKSTYIFSVNVDIYLNTIKWNIIHTKSWAQKFRGTLGYILTSCVCHTVPLCF